jgi:hypothetical protein
VKRWWSLLALGVLLTFSLGIDECDDEDFWFAGQFISQAVLSESPDPAVRAAGETVEAVDKARETEKLELKGPLEFQAWTMSALDMLRAQAPDAYKQVLASVATIELVEKGSGMYVAERRFAVGKGTAFADGYSQDQQLVWFAGTIVHDACHSALHSRGEVYHGKEGELACLRQQKAALLKLKDESGFADHVQSLIDHADDASSQYWTVPDRHW